MVLWWGCVRSLFGGLGRDIGWSVLSDLGWLSIFAGLFDILLGSHLVGKFLISQRSQVVSVDMAVWVAGRSEWECAGSCLECDEVRKELFFHR